MKFEIEHRANLSYEDFAEHYLFPSKPVVITDAIRHWKALSRWTPEFFKREFGDMKFTIGDGKDVKTDYKGNGSVEYTMAGFIDRVLDSTEENPAPYFRNRILYDLFPSLKQDIEPLPEYFLPNWLPDRYFVKYVREVLNRGAALEIYIGGKGGAFPVLHYDGAGVHAFLMQVYGQKQFILYSPEQEQFLYPSPEKQNLSLLNSLDKPDLAKFPLFAEAVPTTFILEPGELLFIPSHWWHTTKMLTPSISISANVVNESNWHELVDFVCMRRSMLSRIPARAYLNCAGAWRTARDRRHPHSNLPSPRPLTSSRIKRNAGLSQFFGSLLVSFCGRIQSLLKVS
jgi:histone arginine demethylase JMJD6